jgi:transcriptional regulator with XRE-family HTH domain
MPRPTGTGGSVALRLRELFGGDSPADVARRAGVARGSVYRWLKGETVIDQASGGKLAAAYGVNLSWLLYGDGPKHPEGDAGADAFRSGYLAALEWQQGMVAAEIMRLRRAADEAALRDLAGADGADAPP